MTGSHPTLSEPARTLLWALDRIGPTEFTVDYPDGDALAELVDLGYASQGRYGMFPMVSITDAGREALHG